ncbi:DUF4397 domain-containing protein [bacterium]|nr:MAG: DUF4397 domain-containing protein [bacterium]
MIRRLAPFALLLTAYGCGGGGTTGGNSDPALQRPSLVAVNAVSDSTAVDFKVNETVIGSSLGYLSASPNFQAFDAGDYDLSAGLPGTGIDLSTIAQTLGDGGALAAVAIGKMDYGDEYIKRFQVVPVSVNRIVPNGSKARLIFLNALIREPGFETPSIDFQDGERPQYPIADVEYAESFAIQVDIGTYTFEARRDNTELVYAEKAITFETGKIYLAVLSGEVGTTGATAPKISVFPLATY